MDLNITSFHKCITHLLMVKFWSVWSSNYEWKVRLEVYMISFIVSACGWLVTCNGVSWLVDFDVIHFQVAFFPELYLLKVLAWLTLILHDWDIKWLCTLEGRRENAFHCSYPLNLGFYIFLPLNFSSLFLYSIQS